jgi:polyhydroxyalkanoate synthesis regulator phasin
MQQKKLTIALALAGLALHLPVHASEKAQLEALRATTQAILDALVEKGILTQEAAQALVKQAEAKGAEAAAATARAEAGVVRVPYIPEVVKREIREQIRQEVVAQAKTERWGDVNAVPEWVDRLKWEGDLRLRQQSDLFASGNASAANLQGIGVNVNNTSEDRDRTRIRARLGLTAAITPQVSGGLRITTGNTRDPVSTNQTLGTTGNKYELVLDRAFLRYEPWDWLVLSGGRLPNPFLSTDLVWDDDLNFEGVAARIAPWDRVPERSVKPYAVLGIFPLQEVETSPTNLAKDKWLYGAQLGLNWDHSLNSRWRFGLGYYRYRNVTGVYDTVNDSPNYFNAYAATAPQFRQKGNSVYNINNSGETSQPLWALAGRYHLLNLTARADLAHFDPYHLILDADVVKNIGYDKAATAARMGQPGYKARTLGWHGRVAYGWPSMNAADNWQVYFGYRHLERDAVLDAFTDSDFRLGGTDAKGYYLGASYALDRNVWLAAKWMSADAIDGLPYSVDVLQLDFNARF